VLVLASFILTTKASDFMSAKERDNEIAPQGLILIFPSLKKGEAGGGSQINKTFLGKTKSFGEL